MLQIQLLSQLVSHVTFMTSCRQEARGFQLLFIQTTIFLSFTWPNFDDRVLSFSSQIDQFLACFVIQQWALQMVFWLHLFIARKSQLVFSPFSSGTAACTFLKSNLIFTVKEITHPFLLLSDSIHTPKEFGTLF